jgi:hypothetical protein
MKDVAMMIIYIQQRNILQFSACKQKCCISFMLRFSSLHAEEREIKVMRKSGKKSFNAA